MRYLVAAILLLTLLAACNANLGKGTATPSPRPSPSPAPSSTPEPTPAAGATPKPQASGTPGQDQAGEPAIVYMRSGGFAGRTERWTIYPDGRVVGGDGSERRVPPEQVSALLADVERQGFFALQDDYGKFSQCRDCFNYQITVRSGGRAKTVKAVGEAEDTPANLRQIIAAIDTLISSQ